MIPSRRDLLGRLWRGLAAAFVVHRASPSAQAAHDEAGRSATGPLIARVTRPYDAETPVREFASFLTPAHRFFVRSHFGPPPPDTISEDRWTLRVGGLVDRPQKFRLADLRRMAAVTVTAVLQCSGNGRAFYRPRTPGVQWERGAVGNAEWTGVRLRDVLRRCAIRNGGKHVQFTGADRPVVETVPLFIRSIPMEKALHPDTILAYEMNGRPLPLLHGAPLRVLTPGWMAESCIKWLTEIDVEADEAKGYYMQTAYRVPAMPVQPGETAGEPSVPVEEMVVKSLIVAPHDGETMPARVVTIQGVAWAGTAPVVKVDISIDEGRTWEPARLLGREQPYAWRQWQFVWQAKQPGRHTILCRAADARGETQPAVSPWNPGGFLWNGWDRVTVEVTA
jgi:sulfite oxidase